MFDEREAADNGIPKATAKQAAREKFRTVIIDTTVELKHKLKAFRTRDRGATLSEGFCGMRLGTTKGSTEVTGKSNRGPI